MSTSDGNAALEIVHFQLDESANTSSIVGLDADGREVGRLDVLHGRFALTGIFTDDYDTPEVDGRKLTADVNGQTLVYETAGYEPILSLPPHPRSQWALDAFIRDPHVKALLARWQLGFQDAPAETPYDLQQGYTQGVAPYTCSATSCSSGTSPAMTINTCNGGSALSAQRIFGPTGLYWANSVAEYTVQQCCPSGTGGFSYPWYGQKACPATSTRPAATNWCGTAQQACKGCPWYPEQATGGCSVYFSSAGFQYGGEDVYNATFSYNTCIEFGGTCNSSSDCCSGMFCDGGAGGFCDF